MKKLLLLLPILALTTSCGFEIVDDGYVGIKKSMGKIEKKEYAPGIHFYNPITTGIFELEIREETWKGKVLSYSVDNQTIEAAFKVNYQPVSSQMAELYVDKGEDYINVILPQRVTTPLKEVLGQYKATNLVANRSKVSKAVEDIIRKRLEGTNIMLRSFEVTNFDLDDDFEAAVKKKVIAKEKAVEEENRTVQIKEQAAQKVLTARAEATSIEVMAKALAKNKDLIKLEAVKKWNGVMPKISSGNGMSFLLSPDKL